MEFEIWAGCKASRGENYFGTLDQSAAGATLCSLALSEKFGCLLCTVLPVIEGK